jgi:nucleoside-diphosphate-sugar epimerase
MVYVSSVILLDHAGHKPGTAVDESHALEPRAGLRGYYTQAKLEAEQAVLEAVRERGLRAVILRPGQIFGRGAEKFAPAGTIAFAGRWIVVGDGSLRLPLVYVEDVVDALVAAAGHEDTSGPVFHIVDSGDVVTQKDYIETCRRMIGPSLKVVYAPKWVLSAAALAAGLVSRATGVALPLSPYRLKSSRPLGPFDCTAARERLGWKPRIGARKGLEQVSRREPVEPAAAGRAATAASEESVAGGAPGSL